jgi:hypothetical protein
MLFTQRPNGAKKFTKIKALKLGFDFYYFLLSLEGSHFYRRSRIENDNPEGMT